MCGCEQGTCPGDCSCGCRHTPPTKPLRRKLAAPPAPHGDSGLREWTSDRSYEIGNNAGRHALTELQRAAIEHAIIAYTGPDDGTVQTLRTILTAHPEVDA